MTLVTGIVGLVMLVVFLGILVWWIKALPLTIIVVVVVLLAAYDFVQTLRYGENAESAAPSSSSATTRS